MLKLISLAITLIHNADKHRHISFIILKNKIVSIGYSHSKKTDPLAKQYGHRFNSVHSEISAIKKFPFRIKKLSKCTMVNIRIMADGTIGMSKPCIHCQKLLKDFEIGEVYYTTKDGALKQWI